MNKILLTAVLILISLPAFAHRYEYRMERVCRVEPVYETQYDRDRRSNMRNNTIFGLTITGERIEWSAGGGTFGNRGRHWNDRHSRYWRDRERYRRAEYRTICRYEPVEYRRY